MNHNDYLFLKRWGKRAEDTARRSAIVIVAVGVLILILVTLVGKPW